MVSTTGNTTMRMLDTKLPPMKPQLTPPQLTPHRLTPHRVIPRTFHPSSQPQQLVNSK
jgi:hypothetical protein